MPTRMSYDMGLAWTDAPCHTIMLSWGVQENASRRTKLSCTKPLWFVCTWQDMRDITGLTGSRPGSIWDELYDLHLSHISDWCSWDMAFFGLSLAFFGSGVFVKRHNTMESDGMG